MEDEAMDPQDVELARTFWAEEDVDQVFHRVAVYLDHLRRVLKKNTARDRELVLAWRLLQSLDLSPATPDPAQDSSVVQVVIGPGKLLPAASSPHSPSPPHATSSSASSLADREETSVVRLYQPHPCTRACLPSLPSTPQSTPLFWAQNPLKVPLRCGFKWLNPVPLKSRDVPDKRGEDWAQDVVYRAPCGKNLCNHDDVMHFLSATESFDVLQVDFFSFSASVRLDRPAAPGPRRPELDLSRGLEPTPVELCTGEGGVRPADFRYRRDRWPHGCFLSRTPSLFAACCDCTDGCTDARRCACIRMTRGGRGYTHHRLTEPVPSGMYECGPWCGCDRARCQNRLVQRGIRVRLQVFQTEDRGWGVRCRDDLDRGTFVCIYAGVILQRVETPVEPQPPKLVRYSLPSDDDVEVVTEWLAPPVLEGRSNLVETPPSTSPPTSPPLHVPVIQRPADASVSSPALQAQTVLMGRPEPPTPAGARGGPQDGVKPKRNHKSLKRGAQAEGVYLLDASREGNVSRFFNHSCRPNLFIQNVFTDSHDPSFPVIAFFTGRVLRAGTELTWNYSAYAASRQEQEVTCLCGSEGCRGHFALDGNLCEVKGQRAAEAQ